MHVKFTIWAPPGNFWGPWYTVDDRWSTQIRAYEVSFESISSAPMPFQIELKYFEGSLEKTDQISGPGSHSFGHGLCYCVAEIRAKTLTIGQVIEVTVLGPYNTGVTDAISYPHLFNCNDSFLCKSCGHIR